MMKLFCQAFAPWPKNCMQKTNKAVKKRFKITGTGKILRSRAGRRHLAGSKKSKKRRATKDGGHLVDVTDMYRVTSNLPFHR